MRLRRMLVVLLISSCSLLMLASPSQAHVVKPVNPNQCVYNWKYVGENAKQIRCFAAYFGIPGDFAVSVASCESGLRYNAVSPSGTYRGTWQWGPTWEGSARPHMFPGRDASPFHGRYATIVTMRYVSHYGWGAWSCA